MSRFLLMVWDGIHIVGEAFGLRGLRADRFADTLWWVLIGGALGWAAAFAVVIR